MNTGSFKYFPLFALWTTVAFAQSESETETDDATPPSTTSITPDLRGDESKLSLEKGSFIAVPIPVVNPTLDEMLVVAAAYFYAQTEEQRETQPPSVTAGAVMYSSNESYAAGIGQEIYWREDTWRFAGAIGYADLVLELTGPGGSGSGTGINWLLDGGFAYAHLARNLTGRWYLGFFGRTVDFNQTFDIMLPPSLFDSGSETKSAGLGLFIQHDSRDVPTNPYNGNFFEVRGLSNDQSFGSDNDYQSYSAGFRSYHEMTDQLVLAWEIGGCARSGRAPLWDACKVPLRGFPVTQYLGEKSAVAQVEARWRMTDRWGTVGFVGGGYIENSFSQVRDDKLIPSYGIGLRFMVLQSKRINIRLDYARSTDSDAIYLGVLEAF